MVVIIPRSICDGGASLLTMDVDETGSGVSRYRILFNGDAVRYILVEEGTYDPDTLGFPPLLLEELSALPLYPLTWTYARISRDPETGVVATNLYQVPWPSVRTSWHPNVIDIFSITSVERRIRPEVEFVGFSDSSETVVAKIQWLDWLMPKMENETLIYRLLEGSGIAPAFLGHLKEDDRIVGFILEKLEGRRGEIGDLEACQNVVLRLHSLGILHGDLNRHNFIVTSDGVKLIDFETARLGATNEEMEREYTSIASRLKEETFMGASYVVRADGKESLASDKVPREN